MTFNSLGKPLLVTVGWCCVGLGMLGIVMPLFPTTPFLLVAVWAFSKASPEMAERIRANRHAGPLIRDWEAAQVIPPVAKALAIVMMTAMMAYVYLASAVPSWAQALVAAVLSAVAIFILTRPSRRPSP